jgi:hypothetical protein
MCQTVMSAGTRFFILSLLDARPASAGCHLQQPHNPHETEITDSDFSVAQIEFEVSFGSKCQLVMSGIGDVEVVSSSN